MNPTETNTMAPAIPDLSNKQVMGYLIMTHHEFTRNIMDEIAELIVRAANEIDNPPAELETLASLWKKYHQEMLMHLNDEEKILFPWIEESIDGGQSTGKIARDYSGAIREMLTEHKHHEHEMERVKALADTLSVKGGYIPVLALLSYKLKQLNADLHEHMEIESKLLFPRILNPGQ